MQRMKVRMRMRKRTRRERETETERSRETERDGYRQRHRQRRGRKREDMFQFEGFEHLILWKSSTENARLWPFPSTTVKRLWGVGSLRQKGGEMKSYKPQTKEPKAWWRRAHTKYWNGELNSWHYRQVLLALPSWVLMCPWARHLTLTAPDELAVAFHGLLCRRCVNLCINWCKSLWIKASARVP